MTRDPSNIVRRAARTARRLGAKVDMYAPWEHSERDAAKIIADEMRQLRNCVIRQQRAKHKIELDRLDRLVDNLSEQVVTLSRANERATAEGE